jgi:hypothetical protein
MSNPADEHADAFKPAAPDGSEHGRIVTHGSLAPGWDCRLCGALLAATPTGGLVCLTCDFGPRKDTTA